MTGQLTEATGPDGTGPGTDAGVTTFSGRDPATVAAAAISESTPTKCQSRTRLYRGGRLKLDELITRTYSIDQAPQAFADLSQGREGRGVILFDAP